MRKALTHASLTVALHDLEATVMRTAGAVRARASDQALLGTAFTVILVAGTPAFGCFLQHGWGSHWERLSVRICECAACHHAALARSQYPRRYQE
jgi:hypothetical protein